LARHQKPQGPTHATGEQSKSGDGPGSNIRPADHLAGWFKQHGVGKPTPHRLACMVPKAGLEPARLSPLPPQDSVSTNSTTSAILMNADPDHVKDADQGSPWSISFPAAPE
jgi:hypothetical protein